MALKLEYSLMPFLVYPHVQKWHWNARTEGIMGISGFHFLCEEPLLRCYEALANYLADQSYILTLLISILCGIWLQCLDYQHFLVL